MKTNNSIFDTFKEGFDAGFYKRLNGNPALDLYVGKNDSGLYSFEYRGAFTPIKVKCSELILVDQFKHDSFNSICFSLEKDELLERFSIFCQDLVDAVDGITDVNQGYKEICNRFFSWKKLFKPSTGNLTEPEIMGIIGELLFLKDTMIPTFGVEKAEELKENKNIIMCNKLQEAVKNSEIIIGPIPFSSNGKDINAPFSDNTISIRELMHVINAKILIAGSITPDVYDLANDEYIEIIDIMKREELAVLNTVSTAEGTIEIIIANTNKIIHGSKVLILGFGRIGKVLARKLAGLSAKVTCAARKDEDLAWIRAYGHMETNINTIGENLSDFDVIINTVPHLVLTEERIKYVRDDCLLVDLASNPGGIDKKAAKNKNLKLIWALALPGKVAPVTTAEFIKDTVYNILKEIYKK